MEINIQFKKIDLNKSFCKWLVNFILYINSYIIPKIHTSNGLEKTNYFEREKGGISSSVYSLCNQFLYEENKDIFDFLSTLLFKIVKLHKFNNRNKRTGIIFISEALKEFGFYIA